MSLVVDNPDLWRTAALETLVDQHIEYLWWASPESYPVCKNIKSLTLKIAISSPKSQIPIPIFNLNSQIFYAKSQIKSRFPNTRVHHINYILTS